MNSVMGIVAVLMIGIGLFNLSAFAREGIACLILFGGFGAWAHFTAAGNEGEATAIFLGCLVLSIVIWKPNFVAWPLKQFFTGLFIGEGVKVSGVLNPLKRPSDLSIAEVRPAQNFVYVIRSDDNMVKIGVSSNPDARCASLQTGSAHRLKLWFAAPVIGDAYAVEKETHDILVSNRVRMNGEWFDTVPEIAIAEIRSAAEKLGQSLFKPET